MFALYQKVNHHLTKLYDLRLVLLVFLWPALPRCCRVAGVLFCGAAVCSVVVAVVVVVVRVVPSVVVGVADVVAVVAVFADVAGVVVALVLFVVWCVVVGIVC